MTRISESRTALMWHDFHADLLGAGAAATTATLPAIHRESGYSAAFTAAGSGGSPLQRPWLVSSTGVASERSHFWEYHVGDLRAVAAQQAWRLGVPLRLQTGGRVDCILPGVDVRVEAFLHPFGTTVLATIVVSGDRSEAQLVDTLVAARTSAVVRWRTQDPPASPVTIGNLVAGLLARIRRDRATASTQVPTEPFCVTTVVQGSGATPLVAVADGSPEHLAISGLCGDDAAWASLRLGPLAESSIQAKGSSGSVLYRRRRGRTVWMPHLFGASQPSRQLGCYHRNLTMLTMYIDSLITLCRWGSQQLGTSTGPAAAATKPVREAANALARLYGFTEDTYRSRSAPAQIDDARAVPEINAVRAAFGQGALHQ